MRYKLFGNTGMEMSELALGTWGIGGAGWDDVDPATRLDTIVAAVEHGITAIDTAPAYNTGAAERYVGQALEEVGCRNKMHIVTKCGNSFRDGVYTRNGHADFIKRQCEESLVNLRTDYIDLLLLHFPDVNVPIQESVTALAELKASGVVRHVGVSNFTVEQMEHALDFCPVEAYQGHFSMVHTVEQEMMQWCHDHDIGVMTYGSLGAGILTGAYRKLTQFVASDNRFRFYKFFAEPKFSKVMTLLEQMDAIAAKRQVPLAQIALNWVAQKPFVSNAIVGAQHRHKIAENAQGFAWTLSDEEMAILDEAVAMANAV